MNAVTKHETQRPISPYPPSQSLAIALSRFRAKVEILSDGHGELMKRDAPGPIEREAFSKRRSELFGCLRAAGEEAIRPHIASVMMSLRHATDDPESRAAIQRIFAADLADLPLFAVEMACRDFRQGKVGDGHWMPTQAEIRRVAEGYSKKWEEEARDLSRVLEAKLIENREFIPPERRTSNAKWARNIAAQLAADADPDRSKRPKKLSEVTPEEATANLTRLVSEYPGRPVELSDELQRKLGIGNTMKDQAAE